MKKTIQLPDRKAITYEMKLMPAMKQLMAGLLLI